MIDDLITKGTDEPYENINSLKVLFFLWNGRNFVILLNFLIKKAKSVLCKTRKY